MCNSLVLSFFDVIIYDFLRSKEFPLWIYDKYDLFLCGIIYNEIKIMNYYICIKVDIF
jgi:hypothetical protein